MNSSWPSPVDLQNHLYLAFLQGKTADVALRVHGSWEAIYRLHRVVLIQAGFFQSLFTAGFSESSRHGGRSGTSGSDHVEISFDDRNITRAAFEICIARLYGGGPPLYISQSLIPTPSRPLTPSFLAPCPEPETPSDHHPATPRFLLSLLATAVYLSIPSVASQALNSIVGSVGPYTVVQYLNFALGRTIGRPEPGEPEAAVGLEHIAEQVPEEASRACNIHLPEDTMIQTAMIEELDGKLVDLDIKKEDPSDSVSRADSFSACSESEGQDPLFHYGTVSDKIGEVAACWLARWALDILTYELKALSDKDAPPSSAPQSHHRAFTEHLRHDFSRNINVDSTLTTLVPVVWARGGVDAKWVRALVSSDALFVKGERERYEFARTVVELRRNDGIDQEEEAQWVNMFQEGIYYSNMAMEDVIAISQDISPTTGQHFVQLSVLQAAHWMQSVLRQRITAQSPTLTPTPQSPGLDKELGITVATAGILSRFSDTQSLDHKDENDKTYYPIPTDSSVRLGDSRGIEGSSMDQLFEASSHSSGHVTPSEANFFGLLSERHHALSCIGNDTTGKSKWSQYPPFRFAVEFWDVDSLKEKCRLHSHTIWYAGSLFNVYVQVVRKKGVQLGVYLHRQSSVDPIPPSSAPCPPTTHRTCNERHIRVPSLPTAIAESSPSPSSYSPSIHPPSRSTTPISSPASPTVTGAVSIPTTAPPVTPRQPYRDPRASISAYFTISCASATGSSLTRFTSAPDIFSVSQSWGWKSSSLRTEEYLEVGVDGQTASNTTSGSGGREVSLRATVVLGIV